MKIWKLGNNSYNESWRTRKERSGESTRINSRGSGDAVVRSMVSGSSVFLGFLVPPAVRMWRKLNRQLKSQFLSL